VRTAIDFDPSLYHNLLFPLTLAGRKAVPQRTDLEFVYLSVPVFFPKHEKDVRTAIDFVYRSVPL